MSIADMLINNAFQNAMNNHSESAVQGSFVTDPQPQAACVRVLEEALAEAKSEDGFKSVMVAAVKQHGNEPPTIYGSTAMNPDHAQMLVSSVALMIDRMWSDMKSTFN